MTKQTTHMTAKDKLIAWLQLTRFDKPVGTELLLYPTLWALFLANFGVHGDFPSVKLIVVFTLGAVLMRAAGCAINDFADRKVDGKVKRTKDRPLADGRLSARTAVATFIGLSLLSACLLFFLPVSVFYWAIVAVLLAFIYPFMKRYTHLPQVVLAAAFGWAVPMAYVAVFAEAGQNPAPDVWGWVVFAAYMCWTVAYDTAYAMCDRDDDVKIGVKSTAILFGKYDVAMIMLLNAIFVVLMMAVLWHYFAPLCFASLLLWILFASLAAYYVCQYHQIKTRDRLQCFAAFKSSVWVGRVLFLCVVLLVFLARFKTM
ncbi:4-hydroxybenzoate polyprenyltransferase [Moraxella caviae]|uniref:4-hydroxybenzoate octaprenyltransferase n=1 Tax=Moraxella caviae TaxID=34060 RepID=A0A1S9ZZ47_9GAMM|nr:4-hydroxybenzoate octaprenyltransferase [Moraxella caviae]OOR88776.1 4-hydroxybenzoate polyprenyltransferase [Moraxella caviae]STZ14868.1 4-hydroxybenzoate octaprenyltransferase [Moraxella caviae]VEW13660.1 4-hydroxybenzoate octaprenyltransferase [Moraxella caviae]